MKSSGKKSDFPEQSFLLSCLKLGLSISDLKQLTFTEVMKVIVEFLDINQVENDGVRKATQADIDKFYGG